MYTNHKRLDRDGRKKNLREGLPAYAYSRGVELRSDKNSYYNVPSEMSSSIRNAPNVSYPINVPEFDLPNEEQISYYEQLMMMSNKTIILNNFLENQNIQFFKTAIQKKPESIQGQALQNMQIKKCSSDIVPFYKICFKMMKAPMNDSKWKLCLIIEHSTELRSEIKQIYLHMWLYYTNYMEKVDLGVLETCSRMMGFRQPVSETEQFYLTIRDDYLMASQTFILLKNVLSNEPVGAFKQMVEILEYWKNLIQKMSTNPKVYELTPYNTSLEMTELLGHLTRSYFKARHCLDDCFIAMINKEGTIKEQQIKDDMLCKYWYSMI